MHLASVITLLLVLNTFYCFEDRNMVPLANKFASLVTELRTQYVGCFDVWLVSVTAEPFANAVATAFLKSPVLKNVPRFLINPRKVIRARLRQPQLVILFMDSNIRKLNSRPTSTILKNLNVHTKLIVVFYKTNFESPHRDLLYYFLYKRMFNVAFVLLDRPTGIFMMFTLNYISSRLFHHNKSSSAKDMFRDQMSNLRHEPVVVEARNNPPYVDFRRTKFQGIDVAIATLILSKLNAEIRLLNSFNISRRVKTTNFTISITRYGSLNTEEEYVTAPLPDSYVIITAPGRYLTIPEIFVNPFSENVWILLILLAVLGIVAMWIFPKSFRNDIIMLPVCGMERYNLNGTDTAEKILLLSLIILIFLTTCAYEAKVMSALTEWPRVPDIKTIDELIQSGRKVSANLEFTPGYIRNDSRLGPILVDFKKHKPGLEFAFLHTHLMAKMSVKASHFAKNANYKLIIINEPFGFTTPLYNFGRRNILTSKFNLLKQRIFESGLYLYWLMFYEMSFVGGILAVKEGSDQDRDDGNELVNVNSLKPAWILISIGWILCVAVLMLEMRIKKLSSGWLKTVGERIVISKSSSHM